VIEDQRREAEPLHFELSNSQMNIWNLEMAHQGTSINVISETIRIRGTFDVALVQKCLNMILNADASLRTQITIEGSVPYAYVTEHSECQFPVYDFSTTNEAGLRHWEETVALEPMTLIASPLCQFIILRFGENEGGLFIKTHHIISDGWSQVLLINRIAEAYLSLCEGKEPEISDSPDYRLHIGDEREYLRSSAYERDREYWEQKLCGDVQPVSLKSSQSAVVSRVGRRKTYEFSQTLSQAMYAFCNQNRVAPFTVFHMVLAIYVRRIGFAGRLCIGVPIHNRVNATDRETSGMFVSTLPFVSTLDEGWSFNDFVQMLNEEWYDMLRHQRFPLFDIARLAAQSKPHDQTEPLFSVALSFQGSRIYANRNAQIVFSGQWHYSGYQAEQLCIHLTNMENERRYTVNYDYLAQLFSDGEIENFHQYLMTILGMALKNPDKPIWQLPIISEAEQEKVLYTFNRSETLASFETIPERISDVAAKQADKVAIISGGVRTTFEALEHRASDVAHALFALREDKPGVVAVLLPKGADLVAAMLGIAKCGHAWVLMSSLWPLKRQEEILADCGAFALLTQNGLCDDIVSGEAAVLQMQSIPHTEGPFPCAVQRRSDLAYIVYTSGSTGKPKGVEIEQQSLVNFVRSMEPLYGHDAVLSVCNVSFDAFLIESIGALYNARTVVFPDDDDAENPAKLAALIRRYAIDFLSLTPSRLAAYCRDRAFSGALCRIDSIVCGGEHFPAELLKQLKRVSKARIYNQYGPSETAVGVSFSLLNDASRITIGKPMPNCRLYVLDEHRQPLPIGVYGELYVGGACVGRGYRNAESLTGEAFLNNPFEYGERLYRTGDIACWTEDGEIALRGRKDEQVKLRGLRIEPQEVAARLGMHPEIERAFVRVVANEDNQTLVAYYTAARRIPEHELLSFAATYLPAFMIPSCFERLDSLPMTANGKIDVQRLPIPLFTADRGIDATAIARQIVDIFRAVLSRGDLGPASDYFQSGGNSLNALEALSLIEDRFGIRLRIADLWACRTAAKLEPLVASKGARTAERQIIGPAPELADYPVTPTQQSLYVQSMLDPTKLAYNMPGCLRFSQSLDRDRLEAALRVLVSMESTLRTSFEMQSGGLVQRVASETPFDLQTLDASSFEDACGQFLRPFDLTRAPLFRAAVWRSELGKDTLFIDLHHIIGDGLSTPLLLRRLDAAYRGQTPALPAVDFKDYAYFINNSINNSQRELPEPLAAYWKNALDGIEDILDYPLDRERQKQFDFRGDKVLLSLPQKLCKRIEDYCGKAEITPFMFFTAAFGILLARISGVEDCVVGTPVAGRNHREVNEVCGSFIQALPLRLRPRAGMALADFVQGVKTAVLGLLDHQQMPLEEIIQRCGIKRELGKPTLYNTMIVMRPVDIDGFSFAGGAVESVPLPTFTSKLDLSLEVFAENDTYGLAFEYASSLLNRITVEFQSRCFVAVLESMVDGDAATIEDLRAISHADRVRLIETPLRSSTPFIDLPVDLRIQQTVSIMPDAPAIVFRGETTTYAELWARARHIAGRLTREGAKPGDVIGFALGRGIDLVASMIGIMQLGCAYMPMLSHFPQNRLHYMLEVSSCAMVLCDEKSILEIGEGFPCPLILIQGEAAPFVPPAERSTSEVMHVLFTSGSTGRPKGAAIQHRPLVNLMATLTPMFDAIDGNILCTANSVFDIFFTETLFPLCLGRCVIMADEEQMMLPHLMAQLVERENVSVMELTPSRVQMCLGNTAFTEALRHIKLMLLPGEVLSIALKDRLRRHGDPAMRTINLYGPTECAVYTNTGDVTQSDYIVVGKLVHNVRGYVLDPNGKPVLPTARGEMYLAGECLAKEYIGRPDLTKASFLPDLYFKDRRMYRTGDIVRYLPDGNYAFVCRRDSQVKLNGQRVELSEITERVIASELVREAVTIAYRKTEGGDMALRLVAVPYDNKPCTEAEIRSVLALELPSYMIPSDIVFLSELPRTATGKTDLIALRNEAELVSAYSSAENRMSDKQLDNADREASDTETSKVEIAATIEPKTVEGNATKTKVSGVVELAARRQEANQKMRALRILREEISARTLPANEKADAPVIKDEAADATKTQIEAVPSVRTEKSEKGIVPVPEAVETDADGLAKTLKDLWCQVLAVSEPKGDVSFFEQGGTSLGAMHLLSLYFNCGISLTLAQFYDHPTLWAQTRFIGAGRGSPAVVAEPKTTRFVEEIGKVEPLPAKAETRDGILVTGATGYLGAHLVKELLDAGTQSVVCIVREGNAARLWDSLINYFGRQWFNSNYRSITAMAGDVTKPSLGIDVAYHAGTLARTGTILHAAADVRHHATDDGHQRTNVSGTANAIAAATAWDMQLCHISTISVSGECVAGQPDKAFLYTENDRDIGQNWQDNVYVKSKFNAETLVFNAMEKGLRARIFRVGRLVGRSRDGVFQQEPAGNTFFAFVQALRHLDQMPSSFAGLPIELTAVDECARAIVALMADKSGVFHVFNPHTIPLGRLISDLGFDLETVDDETFVGHLGEKLRGGAQGELAPLVDQYNRYKQMTANVEPVCETTLRALAARNFVWRQPEANKVLQYFVNDNANMQGGGRHHI
jgi:amino acid adenylation domain-containing protein/thioester reductase-like protein